MRNFPKRFGNFLISVGVVLIVFFFLSDYLDQVQGWYLLIGVLLVGLGASLSWRGREKPEPSGRFRMLRRMSEGGKKSGRGERPGRGGRSGRGKRSGGGKGSDGDEKDEEEDR